MHKRDDIKDKIVEMMQPTGCTIQHVYKSRYLPVDQTIFPVSCVYCPEEIEEKADTNEHYNRTAKVFIIIYCNGYDPSEEGEDTGQRDIDSELDDLTREVETMFLKPIQTLEKTVYQMNLTRTSYMVDEKSNPIMGIAKLEFDVYYKDSLL